MKLKALLSALLIVALLCPAALMEEGLNEPLPVSEEAVVTDSTEEVTEPDGETVSSGSIDAVEEDAAPDVEDEGESKQPQDSVPADSEEEVLVVETVDEVVEEAQDEELTDEESFDIFESEAPSYEMFEAGTGVDVDEAGNIRINDTNFPDEAFRNYISWRIDGNLDGVLSGEEISNATDVSISNVNDLTGIRLLTGVQFLTVYGSTLTELDVSGCTSLGLLSCTNGQLQTLNVSGCTSLYRLYCGNNSQLQTLNVTGCTALQDLDCSNSQLRELDVTDCTALEELICYGNQLQTLNVTGCTAMYRLECYNNQLQTLDVTGCTAMYRLECYDNQLQTLYVTGCTALEELVCYNNQLQTLDVTGCTALEELECYNNRLQTLNLNNSDLTYLDIRDNDLETVNISQCPLLIEATFTPIPSESGDDMNYGNRLHIDSDTELIPAPQVDEIAFAIDADHFPDSKFREYVANEIDLNKDGNLGLHEIPLVERIVLCDSVQDENDDTVYIPYGITSIKGIEYFTNLWHLRTNGNQLSAIDVSPLNKLEWLECENCGLTELKVNKNISYLDCSDNLLSELDVSGCTNIEELDCRNNQIKTLNISLSEIEWSRWGNNPIETLDAHGCASMGHLSCTNCPLKNLNVNGCTNLRTLNCSNSHLEVLDIRECSKLEELLCYNTRLTSLDIRNNPKLVKCVKDGIKEEINREGESYLSYRYEDEWLSLNVDPNLILLYENETPAITSVSTTTPATASTQTSTPQVIPAVKKAGKTTVSAAPGSVYHLDLGGASGKGFKSSKKKVAVVNAQGLVTIKGAGKTKITFKAGKKKRTLTLTVKDPTIPASVAITPVNTAVKVGDAITLTPVIPENTNSAFKWKSSNKKVAKVVNGVVTFRKPGKVTVTCTAVRGKKKAKVTFKVSK